MPLSNKFSLSRSAGLTIIELIVALGISSILILATVQLTSNMNAQLKATSVLHRWNATLSAMRIAYSTKVACQRMFKGYTFPTIGAPGTRPDPRGLELTYLGNCSPASGLTGCPNFSYLKNPPSAPPGNELNYSQGNYANSIRMMPANSVAPIKTTKIANIDITTGIPLLPASYTEVYAYPVYLWIKGSRSFYGFTNSRSNLISGGNLTSGSASDPNAISFIIYVNTSGTIQSCSSSTNGVPPGVIFPLYTPGTACPAGMLTLTPAQGRMLIGFDASQVGFSQNRIGGEEVHVLNGSEMPPHNHLVHVVEPNAGQSGGYQYISPLPAPLPAAGYDGADTAVSYTPNSPDALTTIGGDGLTMPTIWNAPGSAPGSNHIGNYDSKPPASNPIYPDITPPNPPNRTNTSGAFGHLSMPPYLVVNWCYSP